MANTPSAIAETNTNDKEERYIAAQVDELDGEYSVGNRMRNRMKSALRKSCQRGTLIRTWSKGSTFD